MLKYFYGNQLEKLADRLFENLDNEHKKNPLDPEIFVVQNNGIGQWLTLRMARQEGVAANMKFEFPSERLWSLIRSVDPDIPEILPSDRGPMTWTLMDFFGDEEFLGNFDNLSHYISDEDPAKRSLRSWKLAGKIADVFDQYLIYRPEMLIKWQKKKRKYPANQAEEWQAKLWRRLNYHWRQHHDNERLHRAQLLQKLWKKMEAGAVSKQDLPQRITVFGGSSASEAFIRTMIKLSDLTDVYFYQLAIDPEVQDPEGFENPLLQSLATEGAKFARLFDNHAEVEKVQISSEQESPRQSVLSVVQSDLQNDRSEGPSSLEIPAVDSSIQVHSCHSPMRETEVLYDRLLGLLDENPELNPDDILIMTPDIETYAPMIEAVFDKPDEGQPKMPYSIADRNIRDTNPALQAFLKILDLCESRFKVTDVLDLLDSGPIRESFELTGEDLNKAEKWIADNRIRWGIDASFKQKMEVPESNHFTWKSGLNRMLLGYLMKPDEDSLYQGIYPYEEIESSDDVRLTGILSRFLQQLFAIARLVDEKHTTAEWSNYLGQIPDEFLPDNRDHLWEISQIREALEQLQNQSELGGFKGKIPFRIVRMWLQKRLEDQSAGGGRIGKGVTFSSLKPMRSIPFKVIGMIGMNEGAFPRSKIPIEFDLMNLEPSPGDPNTTEEDRFLFLENLLSVRTHLYFSYVGQSNRHDADYPPSVVLREFLDYLEEQYDLPAHRLLKKHPLQAFSPEYFKKEVYFSYSQTQRDVSEAMKNEHSNSTAFLQGVLPEPEDEWKNISLTELITFFQQPARFLLQNRLGINLYEEGVLDEDREPFTLGGLQSYMIGQELLDRYLNEKPLESYRENLESRDQLPEGWSGEQAFNRKVEEVEDFGRQLKDELNQEQKEDLEVDISIQDFRIVGKLTSVYELGLIHYRFGSMRPKDAIDLWIRHLAYQYLNPEYKDNRSSLYTRHKKQNFVEYRLGLVENPSAILEELLELYWQGMQRCCYFFPESAFAYAEEVCYKNGQPDSGLQKAANKWQRDYGPPGEGEDPYNKLVLGRRNPFQERDFQEVSARFWRPFFNAIEQEET